MTRPSTARTPRASARSPRRHHWWRWILISVVALIVIGVAAVAAATKLSPGPGPLGLPGGAVSAPSGPLGGTWRAAPGSQAAFRVQETVLGLHNEVGGSTSAVTGTAVIARDDVRTGSFGINLTTITVNGKKEPQLATSLATGRYPEATLRLARPVPLPAGLATGQTVTFTAPAQFTLHGVTRAVTVTLTARRDGTALQTAGSIPVTFRQWDIAQPPGFGWFGSLANRGTAEFRLILGRS